jgi:hypothetical protein
LEDKIEGVLQSKVERNREGATTMQFGCQFPRSGGFGKKSWSNWEKAMKKLK